MKAAATKNARKAKAPGAKDPGKLAAYNAKRDFSLTPEPAGEAGAAGPGNSFVIQKHAARRLHYDFRLEMDGVLKSWAVTRGPSLDPADKRLAVRTEDHPLDYGGFEGVIPKGQYGGGTVMLWDRGSWEPLEDPVRGMAEGKLKFRLDGGKLQGGWTLVRMGGRAAQEKRENWLLIKERDEMARPGEGERFLEEHATSIQSGRPMEEIAAARDRVWHSDRDNGGEQPAAPAAPTVPAVKGGRKRKLPDFIAPQLATLVETPPDGTEWLHEIKFDGYRAICRIEAGKARFLTRSGLDWTERFGRAAAAAARLPVENAILDGEMVVLLETGVTSFNALQDALSAGDDRRLTYFAFDLLHLDGRDLTAAPLVERKAALEALVAALPDDARHHLQYSGHVESQGAAFLRNACRLALEGAVSKRRDAPYRPGRGRDWLKSKCVQRQEFVIGGFTEPTVGSRGVGAILLGYHDSEGRLIHVGRAGTGFTDRSGSALRKRLERLKVDKPPFEALSRAAMKGARWVKPELVAEIEYRAITADGMLRHAAFQGLREDKEAPAVTLESLAPAASPGTGRSQADGGEIGGVRLSHGDRVLYAGQGLSKRGLAEYYVEVSSWMLPHVADRPLSLVRCPSGRENQCFYQKHVGSGVPDAIRRVPVKEKTGTGTYLAVDDLKGLISLVQMGVLEIHPWGARTGDIERPDRVIFDLDPDPAVPWAKVIEAAREARDRLRSMGLKSWVKTTGGKGLHVVLPLAPKLEWPAVKAFTKAFVEAMAEDSPDVYLTKMSKAARKGRIFLDYLRNDRGATAIAPYSSRARDGAPVAAPLFWEELSPDLTSDHFTVATLPRRLAALDEDPWAGLTRSRQGLTAKALKAVGIKG